MCAAIEIYKKKLYNIRGYNMLDLSKGGKVKCFVRNAEKNLRWYYTVRKGWFPSVKNATIIVFHGLQPQYLWS